MAWGRRGARGGKQPTRVGAGARGPMTADTRLQRSAVATPGGATPLGPDRAQPRGGVWALR